MHAIVPEDLDNFLTSEDHLCRHSSTSEVFDVAHITYLIPKYPASLRFSKPLKDSKVACQKKQMRLETAYIEIFDNLLMRFFVDSHWKLRNFPLAPPVSPLLEETIFSV